MWRSGWERGPSQTPPVAGPALALASWESPGCALSLFQNPLPGRVRSSKAHGPRDRYEGGESSDVREL